MGTQEILNTANVAYLLNPPTFVGTASTVQLIPNTNWSSIAIDTTQYDNYGGHSNVTNNSRYVCQVPGWYSVCGIAVWNTNGTGARASRTTVNGSPIAGATSFTAALSANNVGVPTPVRDVFLNVNDYVEVQGWQSSGGNLNTGINVDICSALWVRFSHLA